MKKPEVALENYQELYDYYEQYDQPRFGAYLGHSAMAFAFRPEVHYEEGTEDIVRDLLQDRARLIVTANHLSDRDQYVVAAMAHREPPLRPMTGKTFIQSKEGIFNHPNPLVRPIMRRGADIMGAMPVIRKKDIRDGVTPEQHELRRLATARAQEASIAKMKRGQHMAIFPEGARNKAEPETVQPLKEGIAFIAGKVAAEHTVGVIPVGFTYENAGRFPQRPVVWIARPIVDDVFEPTPFLAELRGNLQKAVDNARAIASERAA